MSRCHCCLCELEAYDTKTNSLYAQAYLAINALSDSDRLDDDEIRSLCGALAFVRKKSHWIININGKINVWKCKLIFPNDALQQNVEITDLKLCAILCI